MGGEIRVAYRPLKPGDPSKVGNYRLIGRLGEGGMGQVFLGLSPGGRQVAVKLIHPGHAESKQFRERFTREIEAARRVGGFHTASVVDADPDADPPWMVTAYIQGPSLQQAIIRGGPFSLERVCRLGAGLAEGLAAIHACGLVHRDLKPSNVILADDGPRIIDFGIARAAEASSMTTAGMVVGTYSYMSPEQLHGKVAGPASDVFALGCTLAFAATGRITFGDDSIVTVVYRITNAPPNLTGVPEEYGFRQLISECLAKQPAERPSLAAILERLAETGNATEAVPAELAGPVTDYHRAAEPAADAADTKSVPDIAVTTPAPHVPAVQPVADALAAQPVADVAAAQPVPAVAAAQPVPAVAAAQPASPAPAAGAALDAAVAEPALDAAVAEPASDAAVAEPVPGDVGDPPAGDGPEPGRAGESSSPGLLIEPTQAMRTDDRTAPRRAADPQHSTGELAGKDVPAWEIGEQAAPGERGSAGRRPRRTLLIAAAVAVVAVVGAVLGILLSSGNPKPAASSSGHPTVQPSSGVPLHPEVSLHDPNGKNVFGDVFRSETVLATGDGNGNTYLWNVATGKLVSTLSDPNSSGINSVAFNPAADAYAMADANGNIYLWNASTGKLTATLSNGTRNNNRVAISPDGGMVAVGSSGGSTYLWDVAGGKPFSTPTSSLHDPGGKSVYGVAFDPDGHVLAAGDTDGSTYLWDVATGKLIATFKDPGSQGLYDVAFSPDGRLVAVSDVSGHLGVVYLWDVATGKLTARLASFFNSNFADIAFSPDGRFLAAGDTGGAVSFWNVATGKFLATLTDPLGRSVIGVAFSPDGDKLASTDTSGDAYVWDTRWLGS
jgi:Protein kinase domain/WD domain, G-beta repeat